VIDLYLGRISVEALFDGVVSNNFPENVRGPSVYISCIDISIRISLHRITMTCIENHNDKTINPGFIPDGINKDSKFIVSQVVLAGIVWRPVFLCIVWDYCLIEHIRIVERIRFYWKHLLTMPRKMDKYCVA